MRYRTILSAVAVILFIAMIAVAAQKEIILYGGITGKVPFPHETHQKVVKDCKICHESYPQRVGAIHDLVKKEKLRAREIMTHQCIKCHREKNAAGETAGPVSCKKCHIR